MKTLQGRIDALWWAMLAATAISWWIGEARGGAAPGWAIVVVFALALGKGLAIALDFMELRAAPTPWRRFVIGWLGVVIAVIVVIHVAVS